MATGVEPRDSDFEFTRDDLDRLSDALKNQEFRKMLSDYCDEMIDPKKQALYQKEMTQLEKERGMDIVFINPEPGYVIKTSVAGMKKAFINICTNINVGKPLYFFRDSENGRGLEWKIPYSLGSPHEDLDKKRDRCVVYDVVFHPNTLKFSEKLYKFKKLVNKTACDALESNFSIVLDKKNVKYPKMKYKGHPIPTVIRTPDPNFKPDEDLGNDPKLLDELYPQRSYSLVPSEHRKKPKRNVKTDHVLKHDNSLYTTPKYVIKQQRDVDMQEFTYEKNAKQYCAIPNSIVVQINLPLISSTADCQLDVKDKKLILLCEKPAKYKLDITLPYNVNDECGSAKFDKSKRLLIVTLPVVKDKFLTSDHHRQDSGVESDSNSFSDDDDIKTPLITEIETKISSEELLHSTEDNDNSATNELLFLDENVVFSLPNYTINSLDNCIVYTFHVKNVEPDSIVTKLSQDSRALQIKFTSTGSGYVPAYYAAYISYPIGYLCEEVTAEAWDNNVILQIQMSSSKVPDICNIGLDNNSTRTVVLDVITSNKAIKESTDENVNEKNHRSSPVVEVMIGQSDEVSISVSTNCPEQNITFNSRRSDESNEARDIPKPIISDCGINISSCGSGSYKGILRHPLRMARSLSESSVDCRDFSSSIDCISSDCIPEESSLKKTVRFNDVIAKQVFRSNSSILGQKKKNQRKSRNKKKSLERRLSESEPDEPTQTILHANNIKNSLKMEKHSSYKQLVDSGLSETSDGEAVLKKNDGDRGIKHSDKFYDPDKLNKGKYREVAFKNDLIFDLDM